MNEYSHLIRGAVFLAFALPCTVIDIKSFRIPDILSLGGLFTLMALDGVFHTGNVFTEGLAACGAFLLFLIIRNLTGGMGFGDVKYAAFLGMYTGPRYFFVASACAACCGLLFACLSGMSMHKGADDKIPFAPFLTVGGCCVAALRIIGNAS